jgi:hypothetical protein
MSECLQNLGRGNKQQRKSISLRERSVAHWFGEIKDRNGGISFQTMVCHKYPKKLGLTYGVP